MRGSEGRESNRGGTADHHHAPKTEHMHSTGSGIHIRLRNTHTHTHTNTRTHTRTYVTPNSWCLLHFQNSWVKYGPSVLPLRLLSAAVLGFCSGKFECDGPWVHSNTNKYVFHFKFVSIPSSGFHNTGTSVLNNQIHLLSNIISLPLFMLHLSKSSYPGLPDGFTEPLAPHWLSRARTIKGSVHSLPQRPGFDS